MTEVPVYDAFNKIRLRRSSVTTSGITSNLYLSLVGRSGAIGVPLNFAPQPEVLVQGNNGAASIFVSFQNAARTS